MRTLYDELWDDARARFARHRFELDRHLDDPADRRRGLSVRIRPSGAALAGLVRLGDALRDVAPEQYHHAPEEVHVTVLPILSCTDGVALERIDAARYAALLAGCAGDVEPFPLRFEGVTASPSCVMAQGFVDGPGLETLRERLRAAVSASGLPHAMERRYTARTAHATLLRFRAPPRTPETLIARLDAARSAPIGRCDVDAVELVFTDWYHRRAAVRTLARVALGRRERGADAAGIEPSER